MYVLVKDCIEADNPNQAVEILDYLQYGTLPQTLDKETKKYVKTQKELLDFISQGHSLVMTKLSLIERAEELGIELGKGDINKLESLTKDLDQLTIDISKSRAELKKIGVEPKDPNYLSFIGDLKKYYWMALGGLCLLELGAGYLIGRNAIQKREYHKLQQEYDKLTMEAQKNDK